MSFNEKYNEYLDLVNTELMRYLDKSDSMYQTVLDAMKYSVENGGKRIRPILLLEFCAVCGGDIKKALPFACAIEFIHTYSLIHDDLPCLDNDDFRRGEPSCHKKFSEPMALLAGDALLTYAFEIASQSVETHDVDAKSAVKAINLLSNLSGIDGMIGGQVIDVENEGKDTCEEVLNRIHLLKTAALIKASCTIGAIVAGASDSQIKKASEYAQALGLAFQIIDDILDVTGTFEDLGKPIGSDEQSGKTTFVTLVGLDKSKQIAKELSQKAVNIAKSFNDSEFLIELTQFLLDRKN